MKRLLLSLQEGCFRSLLASLARADIKKVASFSAREPMLVYDQRHRVLEAALAQCLAGCVRNALSGQKHRHQ